MWNWELSHQKVNYQNKWNSLSSEKLQPLKPGSDFAPIFIKIVCYFHPQHMTCKTAWKGTNVKALVHVVRCVYCRSLTTPEMLRMQCMSLMAKSCAMKGRNFSRSRCDVNQKRKKCWDYDFCISTPSPTVISVISGWPLSTLAYVCEVAAAEEPAVVEDVSQIAMAEGPRAVGGNIFALPSVSGKRIRVNKSLWKYVV